MQQPELFENLRQYRTPLTKSERDNAVAEITRKMRLKVKYFYSIKEVCAILHCSRDELQTILNYYRLDAILFLSVYRISWYDLIGYILCDLDEKHETPEEILDAYFALPEIEIDPLPNCPVIMTAAEVADICYVSAQTINRMIANGDLPVNCDGDIRRSDLRKYIRTHALADIPLL